MRYDRACANPGYGVWVLPEGSLGKEDLYCEVHVYA